MKSIVGGGVAVVALLAAACGPSRETQERLAQLQAVSAEKDSLLQLVSENTLLMSEIARDIARVIPENERMAVQGESPYQVNRDSLRTMVQHVTERVRESEDRLARSQRRISNLSNVSDSLQSQLATYQTVIQDLHESIENQKETIATLDERIRKLQQQNLVLAESRAAIEDTLRTVEVRFNTAYYIVGTRDELKQKGIVVEEGGTRFPFIFTRVGETLRPSPDLDPSLFREIDVRQTQEIPLPDSTASYKVVSLHDLDALESAATDRKIRGSIRIADPGAFWSQSRFLILVRS